MNNLEPDILKNIIQIRVTKGFTQEDIAQKINTSGATYSRIESGKVELTYSYLTKIANAFAISVIDIITYPAFYEKIVEKKQNNISIAADSVPEYGLMENKSMENTNLKKYNNMDYKEKYYKQLEIVNELRERIDDFQREKLEVKNEPTGAGDVVTPAKVG